MEFGNDSFLRNLERPPNKNNLSIYNIIQLLLMIILGCSSGYNLVMNLIGEKSLFLYVFSIITDGFLCFGIFLSFYGIFIERSETLKAGYLLAYIGCILLIIESIYELIKFGFEFMPLCDGFIALIIGFVIMKQFQHI